MLFQKDEMIVLRFSLSDFKLWSLIGCFLYQTGNENIRITILKLFLNEFPSDPDA